MRRVLATVVLAGACLSGHAQTRPAFEVATIKLNASGDASGMVRTPGGLTATNTDFQSLLEMAFQTRLIDWSRVPDLLRTQRFDIAAKATGKMIGDQHWEMLQTLIEDRFKLQSHREIKDAQIYALTLAKSGLGPKLTPSPDAECPVNPDDINFCGVVPRPGMMIGQRASLARIARELTPFAGRPVQDETGLTGSFNFQLTWTPDLGDSKDDADKLNVGGAIAPSGRSFFSAIQAQLGLKLEPKNGQIQVLVIDHVGKPSEN